MQFVPIYKITLTDGESIALMIALKRSLDLYRCAPPHCDVDATPANSCIGMQRDLLAGLEAIRLGNHRGSYKFDIVMVRK